MTILNSEQGFFLQRCSGHCMACSPRPLVAFKRGTVLSRQLDQVGWEGATVSFWLFTERFTWICTGQPFWVPSRFVLLSTTPFLLFILLAAVE